MNHAQFDELLCQRLPSLARHRAETARRRVGGPDQRLLRFRGRGLVLVTRQDLDDAEREKRPECKTCRYDAACEGIWRNYLKRYGWDEMKPIAPHAPAMASATGRSSDVP